MRDKNQGKFRPDELFGLTQGFTFMFVGCLVYVVVEAACFTLSIFGGSWPCSFILNGRRVSRMRY